MGFLDRKAMKEMAVRLPVCLSKRLSVLSREELSMKVHLDEGVRLAPLLYSPYVRQGDFDSVVRKIRYNVGFVNWVLSDGYYKGGLYNYFRKKITDIMEAESVALKQA
ncbi:MAG: hypothetical protein AABX29_05825 [Nanoarchaeota archaeon]